MMMIGHSGLRHFLVQKDQWMQNKEKFEKKVTHLQLSRYTVYVNINIYIYIYIYMCVYASTI